MGIRVRDTYVHTNLCQLNLRFGPDEPLKEMVGLQREFRIFSADHSLAQAFMLLNIGPPQEWEQRTGWYLYLSEDLVGFSSDDPAYSNAHDRIVAALKANLESKNPLPVHFTCHDTSKTHPGVFIKGDDTPLAFSRRKYLTISLPVVPAS
jgi:hypothetical protein